MTTLYVTIDEAKDQLAIERDNPYHDDRIMRMIASAHAAATNFLNASLSDFIDSSSPPMLNEDIKSAMLLIIDAEFNRDEKMFEKTLQRAENLLWPYRKGLEV